MKKSTILLALAPLALIACVNPSANQTTATEASAPAHPDAVAAPMHGWPESNG